MNYTYRVDTLIPKSEFMSVTYMADGYPDYHQNFNPVDFSEENLARLVTDHAPFVVEFWERQAGHPEDVVFEGGEGVAEAPVTQEVDFSYAPEIEPMPEYDPFTQKVSLNQIDNPMQKSVGWTVEEMTAEEQAEYLEDWRAGCTVSMAQFRQALHERGTLEAAMSMASQDVNANILWETSTFVPRSSEAVKAALSMTDEELDEFFKYAQTFSSTF